MNYYLKNTLAYRLVRTSSKVLMQLNKILSPYKIAIEQRATLEFIKFEPNVNQKTIATLLGKDKTTISRSLDSLEKKELITRKNDLENDKRNNTIRLTPKGEEVLEKTLPEVAAFRSELESRITKEEEEIFFKVLDKLCQ